MCHVDEPQPRLAEATDDLPGQETTFMLYSDSALLVRPDAELITADTLPGTNKPQSAKPNTRSSYLVERLFETPENNLFNFVKFHLVNDHINASGPDKARLMDIGCGLQVARRFLSALNPHIIYFGIDYEAAFEPQAVVDLNVPGALDGPMQWQPDILMLLDVLEHLHEDIDDLRMIVRHVAECMPADAKLIITVPQLYRLDRFKLPHLHYPEHKIRLTQAEWRSVLEEHFNVLDTQGVGYLSVLPYLPMASRYYKPDNALGRLFMHLRSHTFEKRWLKPLDLFLSRKLGRLGPFKNWSNDILFVAAPRTRRATCT